MFSQAVEFVNNLQWPNDLQHCLFETYLAKIIGEGIEHYCFTLEDLLRKDIYTKRALPGSAPNSNESILDRARFQNLGQRAASREEGYIPPNFITPELCIKLNNMEAARGKLDRLYQSMHVDDAAPGSSYAGLREGTHIHVLLLPACPHPKPPRAHAHARPHPCGRTGGKGSGNLLTCWPGDEVGGAVASACP